VQPAARTLLRDCRLPDGSQANVVLDGGRIAAIEGRDVASFDGQAIDARGHLLTPGLTDPHLHPDKAFGLENETSESSRTLAEALRRVRAQKSEQTAEMIYSRTMRLAEWCLSLGTTRARVHAEVDPLLQLRSVDGVLQARAALAGRMHLQVVAFPQEGIIREPGTLELLREAMRRGCDVVGAVSYQDPDPREHLELTAALARDFGTPLDVHVDFGQSVERSALTLLAEIARRYQVDVLAGHATTLARMDATLRSTVVQRLSAAQVAVCALPRTDLFMDGVVAPLEVLRAAGVETCIGTNNIVNAFTPVGRPSLPAVASVYALVAKVSQRDALAQLAGSLWTASTCLGLPHATIAMGRPADLCLWPCTSPWEIVATEAQPINVFVQGKLVHGT
jgi:cytosine deaminase